jgi:hypothetical protein
MEQHSIIFEFRATSQCEMSCAQFGNCLLWMKNRFLPVRGASFAHNRLPLHPDTKLRILSAPFLCFHQLNPNLARNTLNKGMFDTFKYKYKNVLDIRKLTQRMTPLSMYL